jgi:ATP-dependent Lon protease
MILIGPPGIGKTEFLLTLATVAHSVLEVIDIASAQTGSALSGSEAYWSNSQPGQLFKLLALGEVANPIVLLEEIDKARKDQVYKPIAALHQLLEPRQAKCFKDLSVPSLPLDASRVIWVASGNELDGLEKPILDRFVVFQIERPSVEQMRVIAQNQYRKILAHHAPSTPFEPLLTEDSLTALTAFSPRQVRKLLESALGRAAYQERQAVSTEDIRHCSRSLDRPKASIGFI